jgi:hypothetical protein
MMNKMNNKIIWWFIPLGFLAVIFVLFLLIIFDYQARISLLLNFAEGGSCSSISSDGKWAACESNYDENTLHSSVILYSTDFPFRKIKVDLPKPHIDNSLGFYGDLSFLSWSPEGSYFVIPVMRTYRAPASELCFVQINADGSYTENSFYKTDLSIWISYLWSISGNQLIYGDVDSSGNNRFTVLDTSAHVITEFDTIKIIPPYTSEEKNGYYYIFDGSKLYLTITYQPKHKEGEAQPLTDKTQLYAINISNPTSASLLLDGNGDYNLFSLDPKTKNILLINYTGYQINNMLMVDTVTGGVTKKIAINTGKKSISVLGSFSCRDSCLSTATWFYLNNKYQVMVWSWSTMNYVFYPDKRGFLGNVEPINGFLCYGDPLLDTNFIWYDVCK